MIRISPSPLQIFVVHLMSYVSCTRTRDGIHLTAKRFGNTLDIINTGYHGLDLRVTFGPFGCEASSRVSSRPKHLGSDRELHMTAIERFDR